MGDVLALGKGVDLQDFQDTSPTINTGDVDEQMNRVTNQRLDRAQRVVAHADEYGQAIEAYPDVVGM